MTVRLLPYGEQTPKTAETLWYLGDDFRRLDSLRKAGHTLGDTAQAVHQAALALREDYRNLDSLLGVTQAERPWWDASLIAERNPGSSKVLLTAARLRLLEQLRDEPGNHLAVSEDSGFLALADAHLHQRPLPKPSAGWLGLRRTLSAAVRLALRIREARRHPTADLTGCDVLVTHWAKPETFAEGAPKRDAYLAEAPAVLAEAGYKVGFLSQPLWWISDFAATADGIAKSKAPALLTEQLLTLGDAIQAAIQALRLPSRVRRLLWGKSGCLAAAAAHELTSPDFAAASLVPFALTQIGPHLSERGICPALLLHSYENQPWEKTLRQGLRQALPSCRIAGMLHAPFPRLDVCWSPSRAEIAAGQMPDHILSLGPDYSARLTAWGVPPARLTETGAWRFADMPDLPPSSSRRTLLCATSIDWTETVELTLKAVLATQGLDGVSLLVNFHPITGEDFRQSAIAAIREMAGIPLDHVTFSPLGIRQLLSDCAIVVYDKSSSAFDAAWNGRRLIHAASETSLDADTMVEGLSAQTHSTADLRAALLRLLAEPIQEAGPMRDTLLSTLAPANHRALLELMDGNNIN